MRPTTLMYHGFAERVRADDPDNLFVTRAALTAQLALLARARWRALDLDGYLDALARGRGWRSFLLTADDGFACFAEIGAPLLAAARVPSLLFVPAGLVGASSRWMPGLEHEPLLDAGALRGLRGAGVEVGAHGMDHASMAGLGDRELVRQTREARERLGDLTGRAPRAFAYPYGHVDPRAARAVRAAGFEIAFSVHRDAGPFAISRVDVNASDRLGSFALKLVPGYRRLWLAAGRTPLRRAVGGALRRAKGRAAR